MRAKRYKYVKKCNFSNYFIIPSFIKIVGVLHKKTMLKFKDLKIKNKIILIIMVVAVSTSAVGYTVIMTAMTSVLEKNIRDNAMVNAGLIAEYVAVQMTFDLNDDVYRTLTKIDRVDNFVAGVVYRNNGTVFAKYVKKKSNFREPTNIPKQNETVDDGEYISAYCRVIYGGEVLGTLQLAISRKPLHDAVASLTLQILGISALVFLLALGFAYLFQKPVSNPIMKLTATAKKITEDADYSVHVERIGGDEIGDLYEAFNVLVNATYMRETERDKAVSKLTRQNDVLEQTLGTLKKAQDQIVESEKMAALGQLVSVVAHELNTPLGAINSSIKIIRDTLKQLLDTLPKDFNNMTPENKHALHLLLVRAGYDGGMMSTADERKYRRQLTSEMENLGIENAEMYAEMFVEMSICGDIEEFADLLKSPYAKMIVEIGYKICALFNNALNIDVATGKASKLVKSLKTYTYLSNQHERMDFDICDSLGMMLTIYHNLLKRGVTVVKNYDFRPVLKCNPDEMNQVWTNLVHNAIQAMNYSGTLTLSIVDMGDKFAVKIGDTGPGIPDDVKKKIFDAFYTTKPKGEGSGLGLYIVKGIVEKHDGKIEVDSSPQGTTFSVIFRKTQESENIA